MKHTAETYREAAVEHVELAAQLNGMAEYGAAHFWAGLAVECMLRAYRMRIDPQFDSRHSLSELVSRSQFYDFVPDADLVEVRAAVFTVAARWSSDHRYRPVRMVARWLRDKRLDPRVSGDRLKFSSGEIVDAALLVVKLGESRWKPRS